ncbi:acyl-CoA thioester hydrolase/BAAT C-terminal domain-containing protein [Pseudoalteromonas rhizosphaerae]|uniref:acyl-CoA thioester hydrolase/BAAT C-terminal domain-containing protein n=1 Tax=Pseudoalteromonas rhizosphaerae TaxID=2518973 RepID=UPI00384EC00E
MIKIMMPFSLVGLLAACSNATIPDIKRQFIDDAQTHPLVVVLGGSEGGNTLANPQWQPFLDGFNDIGISVAALGYYGTDNTPNSAAELSLDGIAKRIKALSADPKINQNCVAVYGFSKGAELALLLGAHFEEINHVVSIMPSHISWNAVKTLSSRSSWTLSGNALDYIDAPLLSWKMQKGNVTGEFTPAFEAALAEATPEAIAAARIPVEKTNGPVLLVSAKHDEIWPSYRMAGYIEAGLHEASFSHPFKHIALNSGHYSFNKKVKTEVNQFLSETLVARCANK